MKLINFPYFVEILPCNIAHVVTRKVIGFKSLKTTVFISMPVNNQWKLLLLIIPHSWSSLIVDYRSDTTKKNKREGDQILTYNSLFPLQT